MVFKDVQSVHRHASRTPMTKQKPNRKPTSRPKVKPVRTRKVVNTGNQFKAGTPQIIPISGGTKIRHRELISEVYVQAAFTVNPFRINPGNPSLFPWLANVARNFETFRLNKLKIHYEPACSTTKSGQFMAAADWDPNETTDPAPTGAIGLLSNRGAVSSVVWDKCSFVAPSVELRGLMNKTFVQTAPETSQTSSALRSLGRFFYGGEGGDGTKSGYLWAEYDVDLFTPAIPDNLSEALKNIQATPTTTTLLQGAAAGTTASVGSELITAITTAVGDVECLYSMASPIMATITASCTGALMATDPYIDTPVGCTLTELRPGYALGAGSTSTWGIFPTGPGSTFKIHEIGRAHV